MNTRMKSIAALAVAGMLTAGCPGPAGSTMDFSATDALNVLSIGASVAGGLAASGVLGGGGGGYSPPVVVPSFSAPSAGNGYSQRGAFEDCARLYASIPGAHAQMAECQRRANLMGSLN